MNETFDVISIFDINQTPKSIAQFETVSRQQYNNSIESEHELTYVMDIEDIDLPKRGTKSSAGYDFISPVSFELAPGEQIIIPTGIRCKMYSDHVLKLYPRSSVGIKHNISFANTVPIIDADYYNAKN